MAIQPLISNTNWEAQRDRVTELIQQLYALEADIIRGNEALEKEIQEIQGHLQERSLSHREMKSAFEQRITQLTQQILDLKASIETLRKESDCKRILKDPIDELMTSFRKVRDEEVPKHTHTFGRSTTTVTFNL